MHRVCDFASARPRSDAVLREGPVPGSGTTRRRDRRHYLPIARAKMSTIVSIALSFPSGDQPGYAMCEFEA